MQPFYHVGLHVLIVFLNVKVLRQTQTNIRKREEEETVEPILGGSK